MRKLTILLFLALAAISLNAQLPVGAWAIHTPFGGVEDIAETRNTVYYLSSGALFSADKTTGETRSLNSSNDLNGGAISGIYAEPSGDYIIVAYNDCKLDRINNDGSVINISDIADALISGTPTINSIGFSKDRFYVAGSFGLVTFDAKKNEARETAFTPNPVEKVFCLGDHVVIVYNKILQAAPASERLISINQFKTIGGNTRQLNYGKSVTIGDNRLLFIYTGSNRAVLATFDFAADRLGIYEVSENGTLITGFNKIVPLGPDRAFAATASKAYIFDTTCDPVLPQIICLSSDLATETVLSGLKGLDKLWAGNAEGINQYDASDLTNPTALGDKFGKTSFTAAGCNRIQAQPDGSLLFWNQYSSYNIQLAFPDNANKQCFITRYKAGEGFTDLTPGAFSITDLNRNYPYARNVGSVFTDPDDPSSIFVSDWNNGILRFTDKELTGVANRNNAPFECGDGSNARAIFAGLDNYGNIWTVQEPNKQTQLFAAPFSKLKGSDLTKADWTSLPRGTAFGRCTKGVTLKKSGMMAFIGGNWNTQIAFVHQKGTSALSDDVAVTARTYIDQDNKTFEANHGTALCEDAKGRLWVGTDKGVFEITDPTQVTSEIVKINHLKVPRNDGTGLADYLLDAQAVSGIACDSSNRKWISTTTSGVYLVSENGDEILEHYTMDNSILPSNKVWDVACDPSSSSVFFATDAGVIEYNSTSAPAHENLDDVYAYPNPVRPDYSGWITVTGLMDNTLVKIADSAGNVFFQGRSEGGMITWDGCNAKGERVKTGVYYVFGSHGSSSDSSTDNCVAKIMVIN